MANITVGEMTALATMVADQALGKLKSNTVLARIINRDYDNLVATAGQVVKIPVRGSLSVNDKAANTAYTLQAPSDSSVSVTLNKHKEVSFIVEDPAAAMASYDVLAGYMEDGILALAEQIDGDIAALYSGFSQAISASPLTEATFRLAQRYLNTAKARGQFWAVLHPDAFYEAQAIEKLVNRDYRSFTDIPALASGAVPYLGDFAGFSIVMDQNIKTSTTRKNLFIHRDCGVLVSRPLPKAPEGMGVTQVVREEDGVSIRVSLSYNATYGGVQAVCETLYGVAELRDEFGVTVSTTANPS